MTLYYLHTLSMVSRSSAGLAASVCVVAPPDLPSAVWPAGLVASVLRLLPDRRPAECGLAGKAGRKCLCVAAPP